MNRPTPTRGPLIGWEQWCDGDEHTLVKGRDYTGRTDTTRVTAQQWARRNGMKADTTIAPDMQSFTLRITEGLTPERVEHAKDLQSRIPGGLDAEDRRAHLQEHLQSHRLPPKPPAPAYDPIDERRERLSEQGERPADTVRTRRPPRIRRS